MRGLSLPTLSLKKSKNSLLGRKDSPEEPSIHTRKWSISSTASQCSSTSSQDRAASYSPLSLHPPLRLNMSPQIIPEYDEITYREDDQTSHAGDNLQDSTECSPVTGHSCYLARPGGGRPYVYDESANWPLKDWQTVPPGLAELESPVSLSSSPPESPSRLTHPRRRPTEWMNDRDVYLKRGDWKRRGIVFHLDSEEEEEQEHNFELP
ncbi:hypothetical protein GGS23DRAFT_592762 [Durotheca rogersii]|uniref:uncharacterized protein n=1 Tax=Durotheca rogersii TaxID=419775 RepID=UPI00221F4FA5|nr:uncharacterized protein GGS23DRAFT_592762 [Durotheca rogersii]KAI5867449.1 hypothetical protein GGS23DRAFT_592762 [Durotheca rogersii]